MNAIYTDGTFSILTIGSKNGWGRDYEGPEKDSGCVDLPGDANYFATAVGFAGVNEHALDASPLIWADYDYATEAAFLLRTEDVPAVKAWIEGEGSELYTFEDAREITGPTRFGDGSGTVEICPTTEGWLLIDRVPDSCRRTEEAAWAKASAEQLGRTYRREDV